MGVAWADVAHVGSWGGGSLPFFIPCLYFEECAGVIEAETLISHCIILEMAINIKIDGVIH